MIAKQPQDEFPTLQAAIYGVALSLDSFLLNGIAYGVLQRALFPGFLEKTADNLRRDLARLEEEVRVAPEANQPDVKACMVPLVERCRELIDLVTGLIPFRTQPHHQLRSQVLRIPLLRRECMDLVQQLEVCCRIPKPFYQSRPGQSTTAVHDFLANLPRLFDEERKADVSSRLGEA